MLWAGRARPEPELCCDHDCDRIGRAVELDDCRLLAAREEQDELAGFSRQSHLGLDLSFTTRSSPPGVRRTRPTFLSAAWRAASSSAANPRGSRPSRRLAGRGPSPLARRTSSWWIQFSPTFSAAIGTAEQQRRATPQLGDHGVVARRLLLLHQVLGVPAERPAENDAGPAVDACLPHQEMGGEIGGEPPFAQRRRLRADGGKRVAQSARAPSGGDRSCSRVAPELDRVAVRVFHVEARRKALRAEQPVGASANRGTAIASASRSAGSITRQKWSRFWPAPTRGWRLEQVDDRRRRDAHRREQHFLAPPLLDALAFEAERVAIERDRPFDVGDSQDDVVETDDTDRRHAREATAAIPISGRR